MNETLAFIFMIVCVLAPMIITPKKQEKNIEYVYIKDKPAKKNKSKENSKIKTECIESLISLGMKRKDAQLKADNMFSTKKYNSVENFIVDAYRR
jgi:Holliday junction resolvasome RuvABC DNA-binding subunit